MEKVAVLFYEIKNKTFKEIPEELWKGIEKLLEGNSENTKERGYFFM